MEIRLSLTVAIFDPTRAFLSVQLMSALTGSNFRSDPREALTNWIRSRCCHPMLLFPASVSASKGLRLKLSPLIRLWTQSLISVNLP